MKKVIMYVHGTGGNAQEAERFRKSCPGYDILGVDYREYLPWIVEKEIQETYQKLTLKYDQIFLIANSIGAYFSMLGLQNLTVRKAFFISPIVNMKEYILFSLKKAGYDRNDLKQKQRIVIGNQQLSWNYLRFVENNPIDWRIPTEILYGQNDDHTSMEELDNFARKYDCKVTIMPKGEHRFHTKKQLAFLDKWITEGFK